MLHLCDLAVADPPSICLQSRHDLNVVKLSNSVIFLVKCCMHVIPLLNVVRYVDAWFANKRIEGD